MSERGTAYLKITPEILVEILKGLTHSGTNRAFDVIENALPRDAKVESVEYEWPAVKLLLSSSFFKGEKQELPAPVLKIVYE